MAKDLLGFRAWLAPLFIASGLAMVIGFNNCSQPVANLEGPADLGSGSFPLASPTPAPPAGTGFSNIAGIYSGSGPVQVILPNGEYWAYSGYGIIQMRFGQINTANAGQYAGQITAGNGTPGPISGSFVTGVSLGSASYFSGSKTPAAVAAAVGNWWGNLQDGDTPYLAFAANGAISGTSANQHCNFSGKLEPHPSGLNLLKLTVTRANCVGGGASETFYGIAMVSGGTIHFASLNASKTKTLTWEGYRL